jgi:hypothetical protein
MTPLSNEAVWLLVSFAVMVVAVLATLYEKLEDLQKRLTRLESGGGVEDDVPTDGVRARLAGRRTPRSPADRER